MENRIKMNFNIIQLLKRYSLVRNYRKLKIIEEKKERTIIEYKEANREYNKIKKDLETIKYVEGDDFGYNGMVKYFRRKKSAKKGEMVVLNNQLKRLNAKKEKINNRINKKNNGAFTKKQ